MKLAEIYREVKCINNIGYNWPQKMKLSYMLVIFHLGNKFIALRNNNVFIVDIKHYSAKISLRLRPTDMFTLVEVFGGRFPYSFPYSKFVPKVQTIIDLGANLGFSGIWYNLEFKEAKKYLVEPDRNNFDLLDCNCQSNNFVKMNMAIYDKNDCITKLFLASPNKHSLLPGNPEAGAVYVKTIAMPGIIKEYGIHEIDILKVDIEGMEELLFKECNDWISIVKIIVIEIHPPVVDRDLIINTIVGKGFRHYEPYYYANSPDAFVRLDLVR